MVERSASALQRTVDTLRSSAADWMLGGAPDAQRGVGWASRSLERALLVAILPVGFLWDLLLVPAVLSPWNGGWMAVLALAHLVVVVAIPLTLFRGLPPAVPVLGQLVLAGMGWILTGPEGSTMSLATAWTWDFGLISAAFLLGRLGTVACLAASVVMPAAIILSHPDWPLTTPIAACATALVILGVSRAALRPLHAFATRADARVAVADQDFRDAAAVRAASMETAEDARTLHDTAINTLGAIASGGAAVRDVAAVQQRCRHDLVVLDAVLQGARVQPGERWHLPEQVLGSALSVVRSGLTDDELELLAPAVPVATRQTLTAACTEVLQNTARHSGASTATIDARLEGSQLVVIVEDAGRGFDGKAVPGHGLAESVIGRMSAVHVEVTVWSAPGEGTRVTFRCPIDPTPVAESAVGEEFEATVRVLQRRAGLSWAGGVVAVGIVLEIAHQPGWGRGNQAMLGVAALLCVLVWRFGAPARPHPVLMSLAFAATPVIFVLGFAAVGFGHTDLTTWQALGPTVPLMLIQGLSPRTVPPLAAWGLLLVTVVVTAGVGTAAEVGVVLVGGGAPLATAIGLFIFHRGLAAIGQHAEAYERTTALVRLQTATREAIDLSRSRWRAAGLRGALDVLTRLADGELRPDDERVQRRCGQEEAYLRQLTLLSPHTVQMGVWFARALREAYERKVLLVVRSGDADVDEASAAELGELTLAVIRGGQPGSQFVLGLFEHEGRTTLTVVGPEDELGVGLDAHDNASRWHLTRHAFGAEGMIELTESADIRQDVA